MTLEQLQVFNALWHLLLQVLLFLPLLHGGFLLLSYPLHALSVPVYPCPLGTAGPHCAAALTSALPSMCMHLPLPSTVCKDSLDMEPDSGDPSTLRTCLFG